MKKTYQTPKLEHVSTNAEPLMQSGSGVYGDGVASDITYGGTDEEGNNPQSKPFSVWDD